MSASRPYAALHLYHLLKQPMAPTRRQPSALAAGEKPDTTAALSLSPESAEITRVVSPGKPQETASGFLDDRIQPVPDLGLVVAGHDLGPTNIDPWLEEGARDARLEKLATALAKVVSSQVEGASPIIHVTAYLLLTRFGQSCEDIYRILHIQEPPDVVLNLATATGLPLSNATVALLEGEKESMQASNSRGRATKWVKKIIADAPVLLRMYRRSQQTRMEFEAYAMWHRLEMSVAEIAQVTKAPRRKICKLILKTLKLGNPPVFPFQQARYLGLLREYAPNSYAKELQRTTNKIPAPSDPWGTTRDVLLMTGLESFDEGDLVRYVTRVDGATSLPTLKGTKQLNLTGKAGMYAEPKAPTAFTAAPALGGSKTSRLSKTKAAKKVTSTTTTTTMSRSKRKTRQVPLLENGINVQHRPAKSSQADVRSLRAKVPKSEGPKKRFAPKKRATEGCHDASVQKTGAVGQVKVSGSNHGAQRSPTGREGCSRAITQQQSKGSRGDSERFQ